MRKLVLTTVGTQGDLHPFIALGLALRERGFSPVLAVPDDQVGKVRAAGLDAVGVLPAFDVIRDRMGLDETEAVQRVMGDQREMLEQVLLPALSSCTEALREVAIDAEAIVASIFVFAAPIVAEQLALPLVSIVLQPMAMLSALDPPRTPDFRMMRGAPVGPAGRSWNRLVYRVMRGVLRRLYSKRIDAVRAEQGLAPVGAGRMFEPHAQALLTLGCFSERFAPLAPDAPPRTQIVGFPVFDSNRGGPELLSAALERFLDAGPAPMVFTLGTFAVNGGGDFFDHATAIAARLGRRAVLLTGRQEAGEANGVFRCAYAPHSLLFPRAAAIVHHGGIGTTGQALRAGKPQFVVPHMGDQYDQARRVERLGVGLSLPAARFTAARAVRPITRVLDEAAFRIASARSAMLMADEDGADAAAAAIEAALNRKRSALPDERIAVTRRPVLASGQDRAGA